MKMTSLKAKIKKDFTTLGHQVAFSSPQKVSDFYGISFKKAEAILSELDGYTLHKDFKITRSKNPYFIYKPRAQFQADLIDVRSLARFNNNITFLLIVIDSFSRFLFAKPLANKRAITVLNAFREIFQSLETLPRTMLCDAGTELKNQHFRNFLNEQNVKLIHPNSEVKCGIVERANRSIQNLMYSYMSHFETNKYIDKLDDIVETYNKRPHRTLKGLSPEQADSARFYGQALQALNAHYQKARDKAKTPKYQIGDMVRVSKLKTKFARGYHEQWKRELFTIHDINTKMPIPMFIIKSMNTNEIVKGGFYSSELVKIGKTDVYKIERILRHRRRNGKMEYFVRWEGFDAQHDSWVSEEDVTQI